MKNLKKRVALTLVGVLTPGLLAIAVISSGNAQSTAPVTARKATHSFVVGTFNVYGASHTARGGKTPSWPSGYSRMKRAMQVMRANRMDVVGLQEFQSSQRQSFMRSKGKRWGIVPRRSDYRHHLAENSIIWNRARFRHVSNGVRKNLKYFGGEKLWVPWVKLRDRRTNRIIFVTNVHDPADTGRFHNQERFRIFNAGKHRVLAARLARKGVPAFFVGDFNSAYRLRPADNLMRGNRNMLTYCIITAKSGRIRPLRNAVDVARGRPGKCPASGSSAIDHVYVSPRVAVSGARTVRGMYGKRISDHNPMVARVWVRPNK